MEDDLKKHPQKKKTTSKKWKTTSKKMEDDLNKNGSRPQKKWKTTLISFGIQPFNQNQPNWL